MQTRNMVFKDRIMYIFLLFYSFCSINFLNPNIFDLVDISKYLYAILNIILIPSVFFYFTKQRYNLLLGQGVKLLLVSIFISIISTYLFWGQSFPDSLFASLFPVFGYNLYFFLLKNRISIQKIESIIKILGIVSVLAFLVSFLIYPSEIFQNSFLFQDLSRGFQRIQLRGFGFIYLFYFMTLNKISNKEGISWIVWWGLSLICIILSLTRTYIFFTVLLSGIYIIRNSSIYIKVLLVAILYLGIQSITDSKIFQKLNETTSKDLESAEDYIRIKAATYFIGDFQPSPYTKVLGNGFPYGTKSNYGRFTDNLKKTDWFFVDDLGLLGLYIYLGALGVLAYVLIFFKTLKATLPDEFLYLKLFMAFILLIGLNSYATYNSDFLVGIVFVFYLYECVYIEQISLKKNVLQREKINKSISV